MRRFAIHGTPSSFIASLSLVGAAMACAALFCGCTTLSTLHGAHTTPRDTSVLTTATGIAGAIDIGNLKPVAMLPTVAEVGYRQGLTDNLDWGCHLYVLGLMFDANWMMMDAGDFALSLNPAIGGFASVGDSNHREDHPSVFGGAWMSVLMDLVHSKRATLTIGARGGLMLGIQNAFPDPESKAEGALIGGAMIGATQRLHCRVSLLEELSVYTLNTGTILYNASLGLVWNE
jgi:hypothetical protein